MKKRNVRGAIALETVMILPLLLMIVFYLLQLIFVLLAKEMTYYAAYCGARAALVYNPSDYNTPGGGVVGEAACTVLAWISQSVEGSEPLKIPVEDGSYDIPRSDNVRKQVTVTIEEGLNVTPTAGSRQGGEFPMVTVTVDFKCPLLIPLGGRMIAGFAKKPLSSYPESSPVNALGDAVRRGAETEERGWLYNFIEIRETCSLAKPYNTVTFPRVSQNDVFITKGAQ